MQDGKRSQRVATESTHLRDFLKEGPANLARQQPQRPEQPKTSTAISTRGTDEAGAIARAVAAVDTLLGQEPGAGAGKSSTRTLPDEGFDAADVRRTPRPRPTNPTS